MGNGSSGSGYVVDGFEGVSSEFTHFEPLPSHGFNRFVRAKRYGRRYLLKSLRPEVADTLVYQEMLRKELDIVMRLQHSGVVQAVGMEIVDDLGPCIVMEWVEGATLAQWLDAQPSLHERQQVLMELLDAIDYIHHEGIVHRDLKPSNIMVTTNGNHVKLIDFGLADSDVHDVLKQPAGTQHYMSPEQAASAMPDVRNDIYSLGMIMREMHLGGVYRAVSAHCLRAIDKRYASVADLRQDLLRRRRNRQWMLRGGALAVAVAMMLGTWWWMRPQAAGNQNPLVDSLQAQQQAGAQALQRADEEQTQMKARLKAMHDSLATLTANNRDLQQQNEQRTTRQREVDAAIAAGLRRADQAIARTGLRHHLDTVTSRNNVWLDYESLSRAGREETKLYMASLAGKFSTQELAMIEYAINEHCRQWEQEVFWRVQKIADPHYVPHY